MEYRGEGGEINPCDPAVVYMVYICIETTGLEEADNMLAALLTLFVPHNTFYSHLYITTGRYSLTISNQKSAP